MATTISGTSGVTYPSGGVDNTSSAGVGINDTQTLTNKTLGSGLVAGASYLTSGAVATLTTQTSVDFASIPSWVKRITISINAASLSSATPDYWLQLGYGATPTFENTGYIGNAVFINAANSITFLTNTTAAFAIARALAAIADTTSGIIILTNVSGNIWSMTGSLSRNTNGGMTMFAGVKTISGGALTAVRITTSSGTDTFDAGSINILYE